MVEVNRFGAGILETYNSFLSTFPAWAQDFLNLFFLVIVVFVYALFIWKFYRYIATKNIFSLNLGKYNRSKHPFFTKLVAGSLYFVEYILILPFLIFFWFGIFTIFLIFLTEGIEISYILIISATIIAAIRMTCYYNEDLSKDLAKLLPFTLLAISITKPGFFNIDRILGHFGDLSEYFGKIIIYLLFIIFLETILRFFDFIFTIFGIQDVPKLEEKDKEETE